MTDGAETLADAMRRGPDYSAIRADVQGRIMHTPEVEAIVAAAKAALATNDECLFYGPPCEKPGCPWFDLQQAIAAWERAR